jgi:GNAT superfamily N-acetyltransferase
VTTGRHDQFWAGFFGVSSDDLRSPGVSVAPHAGLAGYCGAWFFQRADRLIVSAPSGWAAQLQVRSAELPAESELERLFGAAFESSIGPAFQGWIDRSAFRPRASNAVRLVSDHDTAAVDAFRLSCADDWSTGGQENAKLYRAARFEDGVVTAMAGYRPWSDTAGDPCVVVHPEYRGRGHGTEVVSAVVWAALAEDKVVLYQTLEANVGAVKLALTLGYQQYARHRAVRLRWDRPFTRVATEVQLEVVRRFQADAAAAVVSGLDALEQPPLQWTRERARVQLALVKLAAGDSARFAEYLALARVDWRDTLCEAGLENADWPEVLRAAGYGVPPP